MDCYACSRPAVHRCTRCGRPYCADHGLEQCAVCMEPAGIVPSSALFRGVTVLLVVSLAVAVWHLAAWPQFPSPAPLQLRALATLEAAGTGAAAPRAPGASDSAQAAAAPTASPADAAGGPTATPSPAATPAPSHTATPAPARRHTVVPGDTLLGIALRYGTTVDAITAANGIAADTLLQIGQDLVIP